MYDDDPVLFSLKAFLWLCLAVVLIGALSYAVWALSIRADTSQQPALRTNSNHQSGQMIANNAHLHTLLGTIKTDRSGLVQFEQNLDTFCQIHGAKRVGSSCDSLKNVTDYNDQQEYQRDQQNITAAQTSMVDDINKYNAFYSNTDTVGVDKSLPHHIKPNGTY